MDQFRRHPLYMQHNIDTAMSSLWDFYKKRFIPLFLISFVMSLALQYISTFVDIQEISAITDPMVMLGKMKEMLVPILIISLVNLLFNVIFQYYILYNPLDKENNIFTVVVKSIKYFIPYLIIMVLLAIAGTIAIVLGILLLVVGVFFSILYVMTLYLFILPILIAEEASIADTISRTIALTHRNFWSNVGWVAVFLIILVVISVIFSGIILLPFTGNFLKSITNPGETGDLVNMTKSPVFVILSALVGALTLPLLPLFSCILYFNAKAREDMSQSVPIPGTENNRVRVEDLYAKPYSEDHPDNPDNKG